MTYSKTLEEIEAAILNFERVGPNTRTDTDEVGSWRYCDRGTPGAVWAEGIGWHVHDEQARAEARAATFAKLYAERDAIKKKAIQ